MLWRRVFTIKRKTSQLATRRPYMHPTLIPTPAERAAHYGEKDVWGIFTPLAVQHKAVNLGQGFPNIPAPDFVKVSNGSSKLISVCGLPCSGRKFKSICTLKRCSTPSSGTFHRI
jgi:hypothetical protein